MARTFTVNKLFLVFCAALITVWAALQWVINLRLIAIAKLDGQRIFDWSWPAKGIISKAELVSTKVVSRTDTDAVVKIEAKQTLQHCGGSGLSTANPGTTSNCQVALTYYKTNRNWYLGKVEVH